MTKGTKNKNESSNRCPHCGQIHPGFVCRLANGVDGTYLEVLI